MAFLRHILNASTVSLYELGKTVALGRSSESDIRVDDPTVSAQHAIVREQDGVWKVEDLGSTNGVIVQGKSVQETTLENGTKFSLGTHEFEFLFEVPNDLDKTLKIKKSWIPGVYYTE